MRIAVGLLTLLQGALIVTFIVLWRRDLYKAAAPAATLDDGLSQNDSP